MKSIKVERLSSLLEIEKASWNTAFNMPIHLCYDNLRVLEESKINFIRNIYFRYFADTEHEKTGEIGRSNLYLVDTDLSTMDSSLKSIIHTIKKWYPDFMKHKTLECGSFAGIAEGTVVRTADDYSLVLPALAAEMNSLAEEMGADIQIIRDIPLDKYPVYKEALMPYGFYPAPGFPDTEMEIRWSSKEHYLEDLRTMRSPLKKYLKALKETYGVEYEFKSEYGDIIPQLAALWKNVHDIAHDYQREFLDEKFFAMAAQYLKGCSEVLLFTRDKRIIAFLFCLYDADKYYGWDFGADFSEPDFKKMNLYRVGTVLRIQRAVDMGKKHLNLGITNYNIKIEMGADVIPLVYFIKHSKKKSYSRSLAKQLYDNIKHPDTRAHKPFREFDVNTFDYPLYLLKIRADQCDLPADDIFQKISKYHRTDTVRLAGIYNFYPEFKSAQESSIRMQNQERVVLLGTNSYLGAATFPEVKEAAKKAIDKYGTGCSGSPLLNGTLDLHIQLEAELAKFFNREAVLLCSTGYQTNLAGIFALAEPGDALIMDERSHRSLFDAARLSGANYYVYQHNNINHLESVLAKLDQKKKLIISDSVFSMEGVIADLASICRLAKKYHARTFIDEAHGVGVFGENGRGVCESAGVEADVDLIMGTFSKSFASIGGFITGKKEVIDFIKHTGSPHIFSASLPPSAVAAILAVLKIIRERPELRAAIFKNAKYMADALTAMGYNAKFRGTQIVPVVFGNEILAMTAYKRFMECGVYVNPVVTPAVPASAAGFRTSYIATHKKEDLDYALSVFEKHRPDFL